MPVRLWQLQGGKTYSARNWDRGALQGVKTLPCVYLICLYLVCCPVVIVQGEEPLLPQELSKTPQVCLTEGCNQTASYLLQTMDRSVDPCEDFYRYSCGGFLKEKEDIPGDRAVTSVMSLMTNKLQGLVHGCLEEPLQEGEPEVFIMAKNLYRACMNTSLLEERKLKPIQDILDRLGGWPVLLDSWDDSNFTWTDLEYKLREEGLNDESILSLGVVVDLGNTSRNIISMGNADLIVDVKGWENSRDAQRMIQNYWDFATDIAVMFGANKTRAREEMRDVVELECRLSNISQRWESLRDVSLMNNPMTIDELQGNFSYIPWREYLTKRIPSETIEEDETSLVYHMTYLQQLGTVLNETSKRTLANYLYWRAVSPTLVFLHEEARKRALVFHGSSKGKTQQHQRWEQCVKLVQNRLRLATSAMYVRKYFKEESRKSVKQILLNVITEMQTSIEASDWMNDNTRQEALLKAKQMGAGGFNTVAYPDELLQDDKLDEYFKGVTIDPDQYLEDFLKLNKFEYRKSSTQLRKPVNKSDWMYAGTHADSVNAYYNLATNAIILPAGILQGALFSTDRPDYMNYGGIGFAIGHEITHGFDDRGRQFDKDGQLSEWWDPVTKDQFQNKVKCVLEQYRDMTIKQVNMTLNPLLTLGENIADNGGARLAYRAYRKTRWGTRTGTGPEPVLPRLDLSPGQLFWVSFASTWCSVYRDQHLRHTLSSEPHPPSEIRVNGAVSNQEEFARDFSCPVGSPMNPKRKCNVW